MSNDEDAEDAENFRQGRAMAEFCTFIVRNQHLDGKTLGPLIVTEMRRLGIIVVNPKLVEAVRTTREKDHGELSVYSTTIDQVDLTKESDYAKACEELAVDVLVALEPTA